MVDFPDEAMLPEAGCCSRMSGEDASSELKTCRSGDCCGVFLMDIEEIFSVISLRNAAVFVREGSLSVDCFISGDTGCEEVFEDLI